MYILHSSREYNVSYPDGRLWCADRWRSLEGTKGERPLSLLRVKIYINVGGRLLSVECITNEGLISKQATEVDYKLITPLYPSFFFGTILLGTLDLS